MADIIRIKKVNDLPVTLEPSTLYCVRNTVSGYLELHMSDSTGSSVFSVLTADDIGGNVSQIADTAEKAFMLSVFATV